MDPIQSWLDTKEVRRMAESLMAPAPEVDQAALDAGYGDDFEGFAGAKVDEKVNSRAPVPAPVAPPPSTEQAHTQMPEAKGQIQPEPDSSNDQGVGTSARIVVSHALADAKRLAEGSGMLSTPSASFISSPVPSVPEVALNPSTLVKPASPPEPEPEVEATGQTISPFQLSEDQTPDEDLPIARQIAPPPAPQVTNPAAVAPTVNPEPEPPSKVVLPPNPTKPAPTSGGARGPFLRRLKKFSSLLRENTGAKAMFLIDNEGQILIDEVGNTKLIQVARTLANASHTAARQTAGAADVGNLHVKIGANATLEVIPCRSRYGLLILGAVCPAPMGAKRVKQVADYLAKTVEPDTGY